MLFRPESCSMSQKNFALLTGSFLQYKRPQMSRYLLERCWSSPCLKSLHSQRIWQKTPSLERIEPSLKKSLPLRIMREPIISSILRLSLPTAVFSNIQLHSSIVSFLIGSYFSKSSTRVLIFSFFSFYSSVNLGE